MKKLLSFAAVGTVALLFTASLHAAGDVEAGKAKSQACAACHGADGNSVNPMWPSLAGQVPSYIAKQLADFKSGARKDPIMSGMVAALTKEDMKNLDAYYSSLPIKPGVAADEELAKKGEKLYRGGNRDTRVTACMGCHGPTGHGIPPRFPRVSSQHPAYTEKQLLAFKSGKRTDSDEIMTRIAFFMSEQEIKAVAQFMYGLR